MDIIIIGIMFTPSLVAIVCCWPRAKASYLRTLE